MAAGAGPVLSPDTLDAARALAPCEDIYAREAQWRGWWVDSGRPRLGNADKAFMGWVAVRA